MNIKLTSMRWVLNFEVGSRLRSSDVQRSTFDVPSYFSLHDMVCRIDGHLAITSGTGLRLWETEAPPTETRKIYTDLEGLRRADVC